MIENMPVIVDLETENQLLIFYSTPNTLLSMAASELAFHFWSREIYKMLADEGISKHEFSINDVLEVCVPESIISLVDYHIKAAKSELQRWITFHQHRIFDTYRSDVILKCLDCIICGADSRINYKKTAKRLISSDQLNSVEKYRVACVYCFKEHIECLWSSVSSFAQCCDNGSVRGDIDGVEISNSSQLQAVNYWNSVQKNENIERSPLFASNDMHNLSKLEYFCNGMTQDQLDQLSYYITNENHRYTNIHFRAYDYVKFILPRVTIAYQRNMLEKCPAMILLILIQKDYESCHSALQVWHHVKHHISCNEFVILVKSLWRFLFHNFQIQDYYYLPAMLYEIWISAPHRLRNNIPKSQLVYLFTQINICSKLTNYGVDIGIILSVLSDLETQFRQQVWLNHWQKFICLAKVSDLNKIMELCLGNKDSIYQFIKDYMTNCTILKWEFISFIEAGLHQELMQYLKFFLPDDSSVKEILRQILYLLKSDEYFFVRHFNFNSSQCMKLNKIIETAFPCPYYAQKFKIDFIQKNLELWTLWLTKGIYLDDFRNLIDCLLSCEQTCLIQVKQHFFQCCQIVLGGLFVRFDQREWRSFLKWCAPNEEELTKFKKSLLLNDVLTTLLTRAIKGQSYLRMNYQNGFYVDYSKILYPTFSALNNFLLWYFDSEHAANEFKLSMIENCENLDTIKMALNEESLLIVIYLLKWFFNNDFEKVMQFYHKFKSANTQKSSEIVFIHI